MDEVSETDHLFATRTVDEVAGFCRDTQNEIAKTQEELRSLIGQKYRELLNCCDLVVGMDDVCEQIQRRYSALKATHGTAAGEGKRARAQRSISSAATANVPTADSLAAEVHRQSFAALMLLREGNFQRAVAEYKAAAMHFRDLTSAPPMLIAAARVAELIPQALSQAMQNAITSVAAAPPSKSATDLYADVHAAIAAMTENPRSAVVDDVVAMHLAAMTSIVGNAKHNALETGSRIASLVMRCLGYVFHHGAEATVLPAASITPSTIEQLVLLDPKHPSFEERLRREVCVLGALRSGAATPSAAGWFSPLAVQQAPLDAASVAARLVDNVVAAIGSWCRSRHFASPKDVSSFEEGFIGAVTNAAWTLDGHNDCVERLVSLSAAIFSETLSNMCTEKLSTIESDAMGLIRELLASPVGALTDAAAKPDPSTKSAADVHSALLKQLAATSAAVLHCSRASKSQSAAKPKTLGAQAVSSVDAICALAARCGEAYDDLATVLHKQHADSEALRKPLEDRALALLKVVNDSARRAVVTLRTNAGLDVPTRSLLSLRIAAVVAAIASPALTALSLVAESKPLSNAVADCDRVFNELHDAWITLAVSRAIDVARREIELLTTAPDASFDRKLRWVTAASKASDNSVEAPARSSDWVMRAVHELREQGMQTYASASGRREMPVKAFSLLASRFAVEVERVAKSAVEEATSKGTSLVSNYAQLQLLFDVALIFSCLQGRQGWPEALQAAISATMDRVHFALVHPRLADAVSEAVSSTGLLFGFAIPVSVSRPRVEPRRMPQARDGNRITNVPLPTAPKPAALSRSAAGSSQQALFAKTSATPTPSAPASALSGLRGMISGW